MEDALNERELEVNSISGSPMDKRTLQNLDHLGVGSVLLTESLDLTTAAGREMAATLAVFASFEREVLHERTRAGLVHA
jgi:DNA invertase Pin-like site-specific DNA recombinase